MTLLVEQAPIATQQHVLLIDGLDEATTSGRNELASLIGNEFDRLPPWIRLIVTSRPHEREINFALQSLDPWKLDAGRPESLKDIREYLDRELRPFADGVPFQQIVDAIVKKSEGLFLYVSWVRQELHNGRLALKDVEEFPRGLSGVYAAFFQRYFPDLREYESDCRPALEAVCAAREPMEHHDLASLLGWTQYKMHSLLARLGSLFPADDGRLRPFHQSLRDWLTDPKSSGPYWIDVQAQEQRPADLAWQEFQNGVPAMGRYCIKYAPVHLAACHRRREIRELLLDAAWIKAKFELSGVTELLADYDVANELSSRSDSPQPISENPDAEQNPLELVHSAIRLSAHVIGKDPLQLAPQIVGRLLRYEGIIEIKEFIAKLKQAAKSAQLIPLNRALTSPGKGEVRTFTGHSGAITAIAVNQ